MQVILHFFATQAIATQEMQPTAQVADQYMIIDLENIPLAQAQNNVDALIPDDTQLTEDSSSLSEQDEFEMSTEIGGSVGVFRIGRNTPLLLVPLIN